MWAGLPSCADDAGHHQRAPDAAAWGTMHTNSQQARHSRVVKPPWWRLEHVESILVDRLAMEVQQLALVQPRSDGLGRKGRCRYNHNITA